MVWQSPGFFCHASNFSRPKTAATERYPVDGIMTEWLWQHPEVREELWRQMEENAE